MDTRVLFLQSIRLQIIFAWLIKYSSEGINKGMYIFTFNVYIYFLNSYKIVHVSRV